MDQARVVKPTAHVNKTHVCTHVVCFFGFIFLVLFSVMYHPRTIREFMLHLFGMDVCVSACSHVYISAAAVTRGSIEFKHSEREKKKKDYDYNQSGCMFKLLGFDQRL